ncbi:Ku protein [Bogoriella caseilytica]|uniref:Non-homologous end joining protein Ku n=1 Tax=Bogoriella caseilytica TaxID=56055 RepID=A0A3N2B9G4_9MICO|nr:Ku protein [Bogoriella caseilytica]ROR71891.1 Ku protein [Bogoriella caseilytica]
MRAIWKGSISFGLVNVPVRLFSATESHDLSLHQVHEADGGRIRYQRRCAKCGEVVEYEDIDRAFLAGEHTVVLTDEDFEKLPIEQSREISVEEFVPSEQIDPVMLGKPYYLAPDGRAGKPYALLRQTLQEAERTAVVTFTLRRRTRLGALRVRENVLVLQSLLWADEVREPEFPEVEKTPKVTKKELEMAASLVKSYESDFTPERFTDEYQEQLQELVDAKLSSGDVREVEDNKDEDDSGEVVSLMDALRKSVDDSRKRKGA